MDDAGEHRREEVGEGRRREWHRHNEHQEQGILEQQDPVNDVKRAPRQSGGSARKIQMQMIAERTRLTAAAFCYSGGCASSEGLE